MKWILTIVAVIGVAALAFLVYYVSTGDQRKLRQHTGTEVRILSITLDPKQTFESQLQAGNYNEVDTEITAFKSSLPKVPATTTVDLILLKMGKFSTVQQTMDSLMANKVVPARIEHLLAFGAQYQDLSLFNGGYIFFLGSPVSGSNGVRVPALDTTLPHTLSLQHINEEPTVISPDDWVAGVKQ
jgi:hypothetical protein